VRTAISETTPGGQVDVRHPVERRARHYENSSSSNDRNRS
jgi:hypothetical protein